MALTIVAGLVAVVFIIATASAICTIHGNGLRLLLDKSATELARARIIADPTRAAELAASQAKADALERAMHEWSNHSDVRVK